jgi:hypothetical protein
MSAFKYNRLDKNNATVLLVDHQTGLTNLVHDFSPDDFKNNVLALAESARYFKLPTILTASFEDGPNGPLVPELKEMFPGAPYIARPGNINAWDNEDFVKAVKATGKKQLLIAGVVSDRGGLRSVRLHRCFRHVQPNDARCGMAANATGRGAVDDLVWCRLRAPSGLAQRHRRTRRALLESSPELPLPDQQLPRAAVEVEVTTARKQTPRVCSVNEQGISVCGTATLPCSRERKSKQSERRHDEKIDAHPSEFRNALGRQRFPGAFGVRLQRTRT